MYKAAIALSVLAALLVGCAKPLDRKIDASSEKSYKESLASIEAKLTPDEKAKFEKSLQVVGFSSVMPKEGGLLALMAAVKDPGAMETKMLGAVNGKTPRQIIAQADDIVRKRETAELASVNDELADLRNRKAGADAARALLSKIAVVEPRYYWATGDFPEPILDFEVTNGTSVPLSRILFHGVVSTPGRAIPWIEGDFNYKVPGGIEKGETQHLQLGPNRFSRWGAQEIQGRKDLVFTVTVVNAEGPDGKALAPDFGKDDEARLAELLKKKAELERSLAAR